MSKDPTVQHWHREPADSTRQLAAAAPFVRTPKGLQTAIEVIAYPDGHAQVATSVISGSPGKRSIVQAGDPLMFNDIEEAKDAVDLILDRLGGEAQHSEADG
jgi:hypothetical protein